MLNLSANVHYKNEDHQQLSCTTTEAALPAPRVPVLHPDNIFVQAHSANTGVIVIGKTGVAGDGSAGGYVLPAGANLNLPSNEVSVYRAIASTGTQKLQVTYMRGPR